MIFLPHHITSLHASRTDNALVPEEFQAIFERVRQSADYMPKWQMEVCS